MVYESLILFRFDSSLSLSLVVCNRFIRYFNSYTYKTAALNVYFSFYWNLNFFYKSLYFLMELANFWFTNCISDYLVWSFTGILVLFRDCSYFLRDYTSCVRACTYYYLCLWIYCIFS